MATLCVKLQDQVVAFEFQAYGGDMSRLIVTEHHRGQGLAKYLVTELARCLLSNGQPAFCYVGKDNEVSMHLHLKCGFKIDPSGDKMYVHCK